MNYLIKNELRLWFSKKNIGLILLAILSTYVVFLSYEKSYEDYHNELIYLMENETSVSRNYVYDYKAQLEFLRDQDPNDPSIEIFSTIMDIWQKENTYASLMKTRLANNGNQPYDDDILALEKEMDTNAKRYLKLELEPDTYNIYRYSPEELMERETLREQYQARNLPQKVNPYVPDGCYVLHDALSGTGLAMMVLVSILVLLNFNVWSYDFETQAHRLLFTQPYSKCKLYTTRCIVTLIVNLVVTIGFFLILFSIASLKYGFGGIDLEGVQPTVYRLAVWISEDEVKTYQTLHSLIPTQMILLTVYLISFLLCIQLISLLSRKSEVSFMICCALTLFIVSCIQSASLPVIGYFKTMEVLQGDFHITLMASILILFFLAGSFYTLGILYLKKRDCF